MRKLWLLLSGLQYTAESSSSQSLSDDKVVMYQFGVLWLWSQCWHLIQFVMNQVSTVSFINCVDLIQASNVSIRIEYTLVHLARGALLFNIISIVSPDMGICKNVAKICSMLLRWKADCFDQLSSREM